MFKALLKFFRIVNLPTVPGDVLAGAAVAVACASGAEDSCVVALALPLTGACLVACFLYLFGMADNDVVGAKSDGPERPIPAGALSLFAGKAARNVCLGLALFLALGAGLPAAWWFAAGTLCCSIVFYNRLKWPVLMGLCRGLNVACGAGAAFAGRTGGVPAATWWGVGVAVAVWTAYVTWITLCARDENADPAKRKRVGWLIGSLVYGQLLVLVAAYQWEPSQALRNMLLVGAAMLLVLRLLKRSLPEVSAS